MNAKQEACSANVEPRLLRVIVQICIDNDTGTIEEIFPRKNMLVRPPCANIDQMFWWHLCVILLQIYWYWIK